MIAINSIKENWHKYIEIYNRCMNFAPYSAPLTMEFVERHIVPFTEQHLSYAAIACDNEQEGIVHISRNQNGDNAILHLLLADTNDIAETLLSDAERWAKEQGVKRISSYDLFFNPYQYIQHGYEAYCWGGLYPARNAFYRRGWDLDLDIVNMFLDLDFEPAVYIPTEEITIKESIAEENDLHCSGRIDILYGGREVASAGYIYLKKISEFLKKGIGQIWLHSEKEYYGKGFAKTVITLCHKKLFSMGASRVILATNNALFRAIRFYYSLGYRAEPIHAFMFSKQLR